MSVTLSKHSCDTIELNQPVNTQWQVTCLIASKQFGCISHYYKVSHCFAQTMHGTTAQLKVSKVPSCLAESEQHKGFANPLSRGC